MSYPADIFHGNNFEDIIPTAEELLKKYENTILSTEDVMIEFAKLHVEAALKAVNKECDNEIEKDFINSKLIFNAYPLDNIK